MQRGLGRLAGHERVVAGGGRLADEPCRAAGDHGHPLDSLRAASKTCGGRRSPRGGRQARRTWRARPRPAEAPFEEALRLRDPQLARDDDVVADLRVRVERQVVSGERDVALEERLEPPLHREVDDPRLVFPVLAVVDDGSPRCLLGRRKASSDDETEAAIFVTSSAPTTWRPIGP